MCGGGGREREREPGGGPGGERGPGSRGLESHFISDPRPSYLFVSSGRNLTGLTHSTSAAYPTLLPPATHFSKRERERDRQTYRQTDRQTATETATERLRQRQTDRQTETQRETERERDTAASFI